MISWPPEVTLSRNGIRLEPLTLAHESGLADAAADGELWKLRVTSVPAPGDERAYIETAMKTRRAFAVIEERTGRVLGSTSYHDNIEAVKRVMIGFTWYAKSLQRSNVNTTCKLMLMAHAFDTLGCNIVGWATDIFNFDSQRAIEKLGARRDGTVRGNALRRDGTIRDSVYYSMTRDEWPEQREKLEARLKDGGYTPSIPSTQFEISFGDIVPENSLDFILLRAGALGERFVATSGITLAQSFVHKEAENAVLRGAFVNGKAAGLFMLYDPTRKRRENKADDELYIWRFMVDLRFQRKALGSAMMREVIHMAMARPQIKSITLSYWPEDGNPKPFYEKFGFRETGNIDDGELEMKVSVADAAKFL